MQRRKGGMGKASRFDEHGDPAEDKERRNRTAYYQKIPDVGGVWYYQIAVSNYKNWNAF